MIFKNIVYLTLALSLLYIAKATRIVAVTSSENGGNNSYLKLVKDFNNYSKENNLNITLELNYLSKENFTVEVTDYESSLEALFRKGSDKYDLIYFDNIFSHKFGPYLLNLNDYLSEEDYSIYKDEIISQTCYYNDNLIGLPINVDLTVLYYNEDLLNKYNKAIPKTWDELLETGKYILDEEKKLNNEIIAYNGGFDDLETGTCSIYEYIYTFRDSIDSPFPRLKSQTTKDALEKMKKIKEEIASDDIFKSNYYFGCDKIKEGKYLFIKYWYAPVTLSGYKFALLPGYSTGKSGSVIGGFNLGINKFISDERKTAAVTAFKFLTTKDEQKSLILDYKISSAVSSLYDDSDVCEMVNCEVFKNAQFIARPSSQTNNYSEWSEKFRNCIYEYLYGDKTTTEVLKNAEKLTEQYSGSSSPRKTLYGLFTFIFIYTIISAFLSF